MLSKYKLNSTRPTPCALYPFRKLKEWNEASEFGGCKTKSVTGRRVREMRQPDPCAYNAGRWVRELVRAQLVVALSNGSEQGMIMDKFWHFAQSVQNIVGETLSTLPSVVEATAVRANDGHRGVDVCGWLG